MEQTVLLIKDVSKDINGILFLEDVSQGIIVVRTNFGMELFVDVNLAIFG